MGFSFSSLLLSIINSLNSISVVFPLFIKYKIDNLTPVFKKISSFNLITFFKLRFFTKYSLVLVCKLESLKRTLSGTIIAQRPPSFNDDIINCKNNGSDLVPLILSCLIRTQHSA